jgi:NAD(P)-dependent dehydrogenase (short-subunit alcohol dehydrogenase family)
MSASFVGALVTGGASGIGAAVSARLRDRGVPVVVADLTDPGTGPFVRCDVRDESDCEAAVATAEQQLGGVDLVVLCAGVGGDASTPETMDLDAYRRVTGVNLDGVVFGIRAATPALRRSGGGAIVTIASLAALSPSPENPLYAMTKAGVVGLVRALGPVLATEHITLNAICPGFVDTPMIDRLRDRFAAHGFPVIDPATVVDAVLLAATAGTSGEAYLVQAGYEPAPYRFRGVPGARGADGTTVPPPPPDA